MQAIFKAIKDSDLDQVKAIIEDNPEFVNTTATDDKRIVGKSPLQYAIETNNCEIAHYLIDHNADIHFIGPASLDGWEMPILHFAIKSTIRNSRFPRREADGPKNDGVLFNEHLKLLKRLLEEGADVHQQDSYGNLPIMRAVLDALNLDLSITDEELDEDLETIFALLVQHGCDLKERTKTRKSVEEMFRNNIVLDYF